MDLEDVKRIYFYECSKENSSEQMAKDFWLFSYFGNGMNEGHRFSQVGKLKWRLPHLRKGKDGRRS